MYTKCVHILKRTCIDLYGKYYAMIIFALSWKFVRNIQSREQRTGNSFVSIHLEAQCFYSNNKTK